MSKCKDVLKTCSGARDARRRLSICAPAAGRVSFAVPEDECSPAAVRQNTILSASARGPVTGRGAHDGQRRLTISTPAAGHVRCTLPGTIDEEWSPEVDRQSNILSMSTHGGVTGSGARDVRRKSNVSTPAAHHVRFALPGAVEEDEEWCPAAIRQNTILSESARGLVTSGGARDVQRRLNIYTPAAGQENIAPPGADEKRVAEKQKTQQNKKGICAYICRKWRDVKRFFCICENEDELEPTDLADPQQGPSDLPSSARKDDWQNPSGLKPVGCHKPGCCPPGLNTLKKTKLQEEPDHNQGLFDPAELRAQPDQAFCKPGPFGLHGAREQDSPFGLERARHEEPAYCLAGSYTLEKKEIQEETDHNQGLFDPAELRAQPDQPFCKPGPFGLHGAREQDSPFGLERARHEEPDYCQSGSFTLKKTEIQDETKHGPFDPELRGQTDSQPGPSALQSWTLENYWDFTPIRTNPAGCHKPGCCPPGSSKSKQTAADPEPGSSNQVPSAHSDQADPQPGPSSLQSSGHKDEQPARSFKMLYEVKQQIGQGGFGAVYEATRKSDGRKVAIKFIEKSWLFDDFIEMPGYAKALHAEVAFNLMLLKPEKSPYIVEMLDWFEEEHQYILVLEFPYPCMDLLEFIKRNGGRLSEVQARHLMRQAVLASIHCIDSGVYHRDFKITNILVKTDSMDLKLIDFGICELVESFGTSYHSGRRFVVGEMITELGFLLHTMLHGPSLLGGGNTPSTVVISKECGDLIDWCQNHDRDRRPTFEELLKHKWFKSYEADPQIDSSD
ncbi:kinesin light chain 4 isoform X1 [Misgurnus anguillicaudatus]|uniref:kinesin light chain 4 isoform X1 n=1 Tax=Misgurnus anguillicaudatus TaxID=75329 RepID=UPI003CCF51D8